MSGRIHAMFVASHPVQYIAPFFRRLAAHPEVNLHVLYCSLQGVQQGYDPEFGMRVAWDTPLLDGYRWTVLPNRSPRPGIGRFGGLLNPSIWTTIRRERPDVVYLAGYAYASYWIAMRAARSCGAAVAMASDATTLAPRDHAAWKSLVKPAIVPRIFRSVDAVCVPSSAGVRFMKSIGVELERVVLAPYAIDNDAFASAAARADVGAERARLGIPADAPVALFCAKLQPWKRPFDALRGFAAAQRSDAYLLFAGDGPERAALQAEAASLGVSDRVRFFGFTNQSRLPAVYAMADVLLLPSEHEPWGLVVNEAMACSRPVIVSEAVGARHDLLESARTGFVHRVGDVDEIASLLAKALADRQGLAAMGRAAASRLATWSYLEQVEGTVAAFRKAIDHRRKRR